MRKHIVKQGECVTTIARRFGLTDPQALWNDPANADLRQRRKDLNVLQPGDQIFIPEVKPKSFSCEPDKLHQFQATLPRKRLRLALQTPSGQPLRGATFRLRAGALDRTGTVGSDGMLDEQVDALLERAELSVNGGPFAEIAIGHLNPLEDTTDQGVSGVQARLRNLGYGDVPIDGVVGPTTREAIRDFEQKSGLQQTGELSDALTAKLKSAHGC